jgi:hypothetical protein
MSCSIVRWLCLAVAVASVAACSENLPTTPTTPTVDPITEIFSGTLNPNGAATHTFSSSGAGTATATLTSISPDDTLSMGLSMGIWNGTGCSIVLSNDMAVQSSSLLGNVSQAGQLCIRVYDVGQFTEPTTYEVTVVHP